MGQIAGTTLGTGTPIGFGTPQLSWGVSPVQQTLQTLQFLPQLLQQLYAVQQQQLLYLQQLLQVVPAQLQQLQQVIQLQHQFPYFQQQPYGSPLQGSFGFGLGSPAFAGQTTAQVM